MAGRYGRKYKTLLSGTDLEKVPLLSVGQRFPTFLAPGTSFVEDNFFPRMWGDSLGMIQARYVYCALYFYFLKIYLFIYF